MQLEDGGVYSVRDEQQSSAFVAQRGVVGEVVRERLMDVIVIVQPAESTAGRGLVSSAHLRLLLAGHDVPLMQPSDRSRGKYL